MKTKYKFKNFKYKEIDDKDKFYWFKVKID